MNSPQSIHRVSHEIKRRKLQVLRVTDLTPRMRRVTLHGPELTGFISLGTDDHVKLLFATTPEEQAALEDFTPGGNSEGPRPAMRDYTPRRYDPVSGELDIDFVLHGDGPAATWAEQVQPGQSLYIAGPRGSMIVPDMFDSYLLIGDETALPAISRRLESLPAGRRALVVVEIQDDAERQTLESAAHIEVTWVVRGQQDLVQVVAGLQLPAGELYAWVATESALSRRIRRVLLDDLGVNEAAMKAAGYWRLDESDES
ncbi:siderophore-interacting protein [Xanthomonas sp. WHRI 1810A]|uniref:siderophore-interacting protein n=1 Tax=Xanthomonas sp. WHRI 1810A TaxID=3161565 RepID=UPI0032E903E0